jgi:hypothetical protein
MLRWEYLELEIHDYFWKDSTGQGGAIPELPTEQGDLWSVQPLCNALGAQGWELVGAVGSESLSQYKLFFKRPKHEESSHAAVGVLSAPS